MAAGTIELDQVSPRPVVTLHHRTFFPDISPFGYNDSYACRGKVIASNCAMNTKSLGFLLGGLSFATAIVIPNYNPLLASSNCTNITFTVRASAINTIVDQQPNSALDTAAKVDAYLKALPSTIRDGKPGNRSGVFQLAAVYCEPILPENLGSDETTTVVNFSRIYSHPLQVLIHGSTYTKEYWDMGAWAGTNLSYSWRAAANSAGYATLAVDKLGNGASSHPDPIQDVQLPLQMEAIHALIAQIRSGRSSVPRAKKYILVGHSSGSLLTAALAQTYPNDVDAVVLTGYPPRPITGAQNATLVPRYAPAALSDPQRFGSLSYGYLLGNSLSSRTAYGYYQGGYDPAIAAADYATRGVQPIGEAINLGPRDRPDFKGKVLVVTGARDQVVCGSTPAQLCSSVNEAVMDVNSTFPSSTGFGYFSPEVGHCLNWHHNALRIFDVTSQKLDYLLGRESESRQWTLFNDQVFKKKISGLNFTVLNTANNIG